MKTDPLSRFTLSHRGNTVSTDDGAVTLARVLDGRRRKNRRSRWLRLSAVPMLALLGSGVTIASLKVWQRFNRPAAVQWAAKRRSDLDNKRHAAAFTRVAPVPTVFEAPVKPPFANVVATAQPERVLYERAHELHFKQRASRRALRAWEIYLRIYPGGMFGPEAKFNRAICLLQLADWPAARKALEEISRNPPESYRREEAKNLLQWIDENARLSPGG